MTTVTYLPQHAPLPDGALNGAQLAAAAGLTYKRVDFWTSAGYLRPLESSPGSGYQRIYPPSEVAVVRLMSDLTDAGLLPEMASLRARELLETGTTQIAGMPIHLPEEL